jgi:hypothetical protein
MLIKKDNHSFPWTGPIHLLDQPGRETDIRTAVDTLSTPGYKKDDILEGIGASTSPPL